jgi:Virulence factor BrkB
MVVALGKWPLLLLTIAFGIASIYRYGPSREEPQWRWVSWGSALAALLWLATSILFSWYAGHFGNYDKTYGSLGAAVGLMTWMWLSFVVILVGPNSMLKWSIKPHATPQPAAPSRWAAEAHGWQTPAARRVPERGVRRQSANAKAYSSPTVCESGTGRNDSAARHFTRIDYPPFLDR